MPEWLRRWEVAVTYRTEAGANQVIYDIEEIAELHDLIENGPNWNTVERIVIVRVGPAKNLTVEAAERI